MKYLYLLLSLLFSFDLAAQQAPKWTWSQYYGSHLNDKPSGICTDMDGNVYTIASYQDSITIGTNHYPQPKYDTDGLLLKHDRNGKLLFSSSFRVGYRSSGFSTVSLNAVSADDDQNVYVAGTFIDTLKVGALTLYATAGTSTEGFIAKLDKSGNAVWLKGFGGSGDDNIVDMKTDHAGNIVILGTYSAYSRVYGAITVNALSNSSNFMLAKLDANGNFLWIKSTKNGYVYPSKLVVDDNNNYFAAGDQNGPFTFDGTTQIGSGNNFFLFLLKYNSAGSLQWVVNPAYAETTYLQAIAADHLGNVYLTGRYQSDSMVFNKTIAVRSSAYYSYFLASYTGNGIPNWAWGFNTQYQEPAVSLATDLNNNCYLSGYVEGPWTYNGNTVAYESSLNRIGITKFKTDGSIGWQEFEAYATPIAMTSDANGNITVAGLYVPNTVPVRIGDSVVFNATRTDPDIFIARLSAQNLVTTNQPFKALYCTGDTIRIPFAIVDTVFKAGNIFTVERSDVNGSFKAPSVVGTVTTANASDSIAIPIPPGTGAGFYLFRLRSSNPAYVSLPFSNPVEIEPAPNKPVILSNINTLDAGVSGAFYQWYKDNVLLGGVTSQTYTPSQTGMYSVTISYGTGCFATSDPIYFAPLNITGVTSIDDIIIYPNPCVDGTITVRSSAPINSISLYTITGKQIVTKTYADLLTVKPDFGTLSPGLYTIRMQTNKGSFVKTLNVQ